jgi:TonB family protein
MKWDILLGVFVLAPTLFIGLRSSADDAARKIKQRVTPLYPMAAKQFNASGTVKLEIEVAPGGNVKSVRALGGHPLLIPAAEEAVRKWKYEPARETTTTVVEFRFTPSQ